MEQLIALVAFSFAMAASPGPTNILLWASGATFGLPRTLPFVLGTALGIGLMTLAAAAGLSVLVTAVPSIETAMKVGGSAYLVYLAWQIARAGTLQRPGVARPFGLVAATGFQVINPKAWVFALGAVTTFRLTGLPTMLGSALVPVVMMIVVVPSALLWVGAGNALGRLISGPRGRRVVSLALAALLVLSVGLVWV